MSDNCCTLYSGEVYISDSNLSGGWGTRWGIGWGAASPSNSLGVSIGNIDRLRILHEHEFIKRIGQYKGLTLPQCIASRFGEVRLELTFSCMSVDNLRRMLYGESRTEAVVNMTETVSGYPSSLTTGFVAGELISFDKFPVTGVSQVNAINNLGISTLLVENTDYCVEDFGVKVIRPFSLNEAERIEVEYTANGESSVIEAVVKEPNPIRMVFVGQNEANQKEKVKVECYSVRLAMTDSLDLFEANGEFQTITLRGVLTPDMSIKDDTLSKFYKQTRMEVA